MFARFKHLKFLVRLLLFFLLAGCTAPATPTAKAIPTPTSTLTIVTVPVKEFAITYVGFTQIDDNHVGIDVETSGFGGVGVTIKVSYNDSPQGDHSGQWHILKELGVPKFTEVDRPVLDTSKLPVGKYLFKVEAKCPDDPNWDHPLIDYIVYQKK